MATKVSINIPNYSLLIHDAVQETLSEAGHAIVAEAKKNSPVNIGFYRNNIIFDKKNTVTANANYSSAIEYGTKPYTIIPKSAKVLHFTINGKDVFAKRVNIPARKPRPVMRNAALKVQKEIGGMFKRNFEKK